MSAYWLGVLTTPAVVAALFLAWAAWLRITAALASRGFTSEIRWRRDLSRISDYTLRHDIWWERSFGPVFVGGWYREQPAYQAPSRARFNRWIGLGRTEGPCLTFFRSRDLGEVHTPKET